MLLLDVILTYLMLIGLKTDLTDFNGLALRKVFGSPTSRHSKSLSRCLMCFS
jgi:hypothetical protein